MGCPRQRQQLAAGRENQIEALREAVRPIGKVLQYVTRQPWCDLVRTLDPRTAQAQRFAAVQGGQVHYYRGVVFR